MQSCFMVGCDSSFDQYFPQYGKYLYLFLCTHHKYSFYWFFLAFSPPPTALPPTFLSLFLPFTFSKSSFDTCASFCLLVPPCASFCLFYASLYDTLLVVKKKICEAKYDEKNLWNIFFLLFHTLFWINLYHPVFKVHWAMKTKKWQHFKNNAILVNFTKILPKILNLWRKNCF